MRVILPGSYDPVTLGHLDIIERAAKKYDEVYVVAFVNPEKSYAFSPAERVKMLALATEHLKNVRVGYSDKRVVDYMRENKIDKIIKGYRNSIDLEYEKIQAEYNLENGGYETELIGASEGLIDVSSSLARARITEDGELTDILPPRVADFLKSKD